MPRTTETKSPTEPLRVHWSERNNTTKLTAAFCLLVVAAAALFIRVRLSFTFPVPWNDEGDFIAQAYAFSRTGSFFVDALHPDRIVMWMPPGYLLLLAAVFKIFGYSFAAARWLSCVLYLGMFLTCIGILRRVLSGTALLGVLLLAALTFLSPYMLAIANIARMESFYTLIVLAALYITLRGRALVGLALVISAAVIHFNAVYFLPPYILFFGGLIVARRRAVFGKATFCKNEELGKIDFGKVEFGKIEVSVLLVAAAIVGGYLWFVAMNRAGFLADMRFQFAFKAFFPAFGGRSGKILVAAVYAVPILQLLLLRRFSVSLFLSLYGAGFVLLAVYGQNMWYSFAYCLGFLLLAVSWLVVYSTAESCWRRIAAGLMGALCLYGLVHFSFIQRTPQFAPMWPRPELARRDFIAGEELRKVAAFIRNAPTGTTFCFGHTGMEQFFYKDLVETGKHWNYTVYSVTQKLPLRSADFRVRCDSALLPRYLFLFEWDGYPRKGEDAGCDIIDLRRSH